MTICIKEEIGVAGQNYIVGFAIERSELCEHRYLARSLSQCTKISNLALRPFPNWVRFRDIHKKPAFKARKADDERAQNQEQITLQRGFLGEPYNAVSKQADVEMMDLDDSNESTHQ